MNRMQSKLLVL